MAPRPSGRPKAQKPRDVRVTIRLTEEEADHLYRIMRPGESLAEVIRRCIAHDPTRLFGGLFGQAQPDTTEARIQRARRAARRANATPQPALEAHLGKVLQEAGEDLAIDTSSGPA